jgi:hypothetical protein
MRLVRKARLTTGKVLIFPSSHSGSSSSGSSNPSFSIPRPVGKACAFDIQTYGWGAYFREWLDLHAGKNLHSELSSGQQETAALLVTRPAWFYRSQLLKSAFMRYKHTYMQFRQGERPTHLQSHHRICRLAVHHGVQRPHKG